MSQRHTISGRRTGLVWLGALVALAFIAITAVVVFLVAPDRQRRQQLEAHFKACVTFQAAGDWDKAVEACAQTVAIDADFEDAQARYAEVRAKQQEVLATAQIKTAQATATAEAWAAAIAATATVQAGMAQATSVAATATVQAKTTAQAQEAKATATAEALAQLEAHYQKGLGYINLQNWVEARTELEQVFEVDPNYKEVQARLGEVEEKLAEIRALTPTAVPVTPTPVIIVAYNIAPEGRVEVSSVFPEQGGQCYHGSKAIDGVASGYPAAPCREWATNGEGTGAWLKITFDMPRHINQVVLYDRPNLVDHILGATLSFSDGTILRTGALPNDGSARRLVFEPKIVEWVQFTVDDRADGPNIGLAEIEVYGW